MDLLMDINTCNIIINIDEDIRWQHHRIIVNFCLNKNYEGMDGRAPVQEANGLHLEKNSTSIPGKHT